MKVGDYVRTKDGKIEKYSGTNDSEIENFALNEIIKSSPNIIDLIEVGDHVNGSKVLDIAQTPKKALYLNDISQKSALIPVCNYQIKSIVTKECFESMEYKVKE